MDDARKLIMDALREASQIKAAGKHSLPALAARALDPDVAATRKALRDTLGWHSSLLVAVMVTSDQAADTQSRLELAEALFERLPTGGQPPRLSPEGRLVVATWCLEQLEAYAPVLGGVYERVLAEARRVLSGTPPDTAVLRKVEEQAVAVQGMKVVPLDRGAKSKMGVPDTEVVRRRAAQAVRALGAGLAEQGQSSHLCATVAGEVAAVLSTAEGVQEATHFCLALSDKLASLPDHQARRAPVN